MNSGLVYSLFFFTEAMILEGPDSQKLPIGANATFHCSAQGDDIYWEINDEVINEDDPYYDHSTCTYNITTSIVALPQNNNTNIICVLHSDGYNSASPTAILTVMGTYTQFKLHCSY